MNLASTRAKLRKLLAKRKALIRKQADIITGDAIGTGAAFYLMNEYKEIGHSLDLLETEISELQKEIE